MLFLPSVAVRACLYVRWRGGGERAKRTTAKTGEHSLILLNGTYVNSVKLKRSQLQKIFPFTNYPLHKHLFLDIAKVSLI
jgi:hypothetical protein